MNYPVPPELMSLAAYVAEDGVVGHHWEERPLGPVLFPFETFLQHSILLKAEKLGKVV